MQIGGRNIADRDLEATIEASHPAVRRGTAVLAARDDRVLVVAEIERRSGDDRRLRELAPVDALESFWWEARARRDRRERPPPPLMRVIDEEISAAIRAALRSAHAVEVHDTLLFPPDALPRGSDGHLDREACRAALLAQAGAGW